MAWEVPGLMSTYSFPTGVTPDDVLVSTATSVPLFPIMTLVFVWFMVFFAGIQRQNARNVYADIPQWAVFASLSTFLLSLVMTIKEGLITLPILIIVVSVTILSGIWFFLSRGRFE